MFDEFDFDPYYSNLRCPDCGAMKIEGYCPEFYYGVVLAPTRPILPQDNN